MENINVTYELLTNSDSLSDSRKTLSLPRKKRFRRRNASLHPKSTQYLERKKNLSCNRGQLITIILIATFVLCWLSVLTWIAVALHLQTVHLETTVHGVAAGSQGVPDALQKCHSLSRQLQNNQTMLFTQLSSLSQHLTKFTSQVSILQTGLSNVEDKLSSSPELVNVPHDMQALSASVASIGSQIQDLQTTSNRLKEEHNTLLDTVKVLQQNVSTLNNAVGSAIKLPNNSDASTKTIIADVEKKLDVLISNIKRNFTTMNSTLSHSLKWVLDDQHKDHKLIESLQEMSENVSSRLTTLQNECTTQVLKIDSLSTNISSISQKIGGYDKQCANVTKQMFILSEEYRRIENSTSSLNIEVANLKSVIPELNQHSNFSVCRIADLDLRTTADDGFYLKCSQNFEPVAGDGRPRV